MEKTPLGKQRHLMLVQARGPSVPDGDGGHASSWTDRTPPTWYCSLDPATAKDLERVAGGTVIASNTFIVRGAYRGDLTTNDRLLFNARRLNVTGVSNPEEANVETIAVCVEIVP